MDPTIGINIPVLLQDVLQGELWEDKIGCIKQYQMINEPLSW